MASPGHEFCGFLQAEEDRPGRAERETLIRHLEDRMRSETEAETPTLASGEAGNRLEESTRPEVGVSHLSHFSVLLFEICFFSEIQKPKSSAGVQSTPRFISGRTSGALKLFLVEDFSGEFGRKLPKLRDVFSRLRRKVKNSPDRTYSQAPTALVTKEVIFTRRSNESSAV